MTTPTALSEVARTRWLRASAHAADLAATLFQPGSGYGDPEARLQDEHRLRTAQLEAERLFREYHDISREQMENQLLQVQRSQRTATWASFAVAVVVGVATVAATIVQLLK